MPSAPDDLAQYLLSAEAQGLSSLQLETLAAYRRAHGPTTATRYQALARAMESEPLSGRGDLSGTTNQA